MRRFIFLSLALMLLAVAAVPSAAQPVNLHAQKSASTQAIPKLRPVVTTYDVYVGGVHLVTSNILFEEQAGKYHARVEARTYGFWHDALPWDTVLEVEGHITKDRFVPTMFHTRDVWRDKPKVTDLYFDKQGGVTPQFDPPSDDRGREAVTLEQRRGSLDPVTALLQMLAHAAIEKNCAVTVPVFDGHRRFDVTGRDNGVEQIDEEDYGVYKGPARACDADFKMIAGEWKDRKPARFWQTSDKEEGRDPFHIWLANIAPDLPEMPVRLESGSVFGDIIIHLTKWHYAAANEIVR